MSHSKDQIVDLLSLLDRLEQLDQDQVLAYFTGENIEFLKQLYVLLNEGAELERVLSEKRFLSVVRELIEARRTWVEKLDETVQTAAAEFDKGNQIQALWILNGFIRFCPSPYYRGLAESVMEKYEGQGAQGTGKEGD